VSCEFHRAADTLRKINSLGVAGRAKDASDSIKVIDSLLSTYNQAKSANHLAKFQPAMDGFLAATRKSMTELVYAVEQMAEIVGPQNFNASPPALESMAAMRSRNFPEAPQVGALHGEDAIIRDLLPESVGHYVDIGAWRPVEQSNTWALYQRGWRGLLIEPVPQAWGAILHQRPGDFLAPWAVSDTAGPTRMWVNGPLSTIRPDKALAESSEIVVQGLPLNQILKFFPTIRDQCLMCSIDVEGAEEAILKSTDWKKFSPRILVVEFIHGNQDSIKAILTAAGYRKQADTRNNLIFSRKE